eukprot:TRINITY_DN35460_c0_g1_i1.p1 TRINITY_DN35460_c0_g1~~TRINITY_DN35460_c0_g1_i1.p1  ORF type:complete len:253 (-),score=35.66 TRINITY_DN35460_c0_g1_i1:134-892(-)
MACDCAAAPAISASLPSSSSSSLRACNANRKSMKHFTSLKPKAYAKAEYGSQTLSLPKSSACSFPSLFSEASTGYSSVSTTKRLPPPPSEFPSVEKLERWMKDSIPEIVRKIEDAPFLQYVLENDSSSPSVSPSVCRRHRISGQESWTSIKSAVKDVSPDAIIFVQKLPDPLSEDTGMKLTEEKENGMPCDKGQTQMWGLVIQGKGLGSCACYILKTTRIRYSTYYCLTRAQCFGPCPLVQFTESWLLHDVL